MSSDQSTLRVHKFRELQATHRPKMNRLQRSFYNRTFKPGFDAGAPVEIGEESGYAVVLLHELLEHWDILPELVIAKLQDLRAAYPRSSTASEARRCLRDMALLQGRWQDAHELTTSNGRLPMFIGLADELGHPRISEIDVIMWKPGALTRASYKLPRDPADFLKAELDRFHDQLSTPTEI